MAGGMQCPYKVKVADDLSESLNDLLHWCANIWAVCEHNVHVWLLQSCETALKTLNNVLLGKTASVGLFASSAFPIS